MKKQDKNSLDQFFRENTEQHFPYDPALWSKADKEIGAHFGKKYRLVILALLLLFMSSIAVFFAFDNQGKAGKISMFKKSGKPVISNNTTSYKLKGNTTGNTENITSTKNEIVDATTSATNSTETTILGNPNTPENKEEQNSNSKEEKVILANQNDINKTEEIKEESQSHTESVPEEKNEDPIVETKDVKQKIEYTNFIMLTKPILAFPFNGMGQSPETNYKNIDPRKRKFATTIEFENLNSIILTQKLSGLPKEEMDYKYKYEKEKNATSYSLNIMFQRGGFGIVTGIGYSSATIKTNYVSTSNTFELGETKYKMLDNVTRNINGHEWSNIKEYRDTVAIHSVEGPLKNQASENVFQWVQVPLKFSYQYPLYRLRFSARLGADFMFLHKTKGAFINSSLNGLNEKKEFNKFNINASGQLLAGYQLNHKIQVGGSYYINQQLRSNFINYNSRFKSHGFGWYVRWSL